MGRGIVGDSRWYAEDPAKWVYRYQNHCRAYLNPEDNTFRKDNGDEEETNKKVGPAKH